MGSQKIRVLVVDDSTVIRKLLHDSLAADPQIEVAATAPNGRIALAKIPQVNPDLVTLDIEMPEMDGITTLVELRKLYPKLPVIMFSTLTERGAASTFDALAKGASDYVTKPANVGSVAAAMQRVREQLAPRIKALCPAAGCLPQPANIPRPNKPQLNQVRAALQRHGVSDADPPKIEIVAIGSSTGGPNALQTVLGDLPADFPVPIVVVQHMPPVFTKHLADRLDQRCPLRVCEARPGDILQAGGVWIAPGDFHLEVRRQGIQLMTALHQGTPDNSCRPSVNVLFQSLPIVYGAGVLAVVLTGMGEDGARGAQQIKARGGRVAIQDRDTSVVWGMPGATSHAGAADFVLPLADIAPKIIDEAQRGRTARRWRQLESVS